MKTKSRRYNINNLDELHKMVCSLKDEGNLKKEALISDTKVYVKQFSLGNIIKRYATPSAFLKVDEKLNISSSVMSLVLPLVMNSTIFRGSGLITKALVGLASGKVGKSLDAEHLSGIFNSVKSLFTGSKKKKPKEGYAVDYGIPPDSETY
ncbi:basic helix-loop-helix domain-containing protein [Pedobacter metabolipauper]|uniref:Uncharacterized protein n=1 Tax=Pedobacter metabolipauper TaxID=425513 RepID=A0A4R6SV36_9SPHI|nr:hypothetical protein [Pedobacter metabolipauper]TDQ09640.1 hypothetical protein ATK78_1796 [Pedobacter metabolipauper]